MREVCYNTNKSKRSVKNQHIAAASAAESAAAAAGAAQTTADSAMPKSGGTFTGSVEAINTARTGANVRNAYVQNAAGTQVASAYFIFRRK